MKALFLIKILTFSVLSAFAQYTGSIPTPPNFKRINEEPGSFPYWLRHTKLKKDNTVYLFNGKIKPNQRAQYAVLDISIGKRDLQQCADACMRLYADWLYKQRLYSKISFLATDGTVMDYSSWKQGYRFALRQGKLHKLKSAGISNDRATFDKYLETVFSFAGTISLTKQMKQVSNLDDIRPGDIFLQGGSPGHAVIVMDMATNAAGEKRFLLAQSYMPAQNIHILKNPNSSSPWYSNRITTDLRTPEWTFKKGDLYRWP